MKPPLIFIGRKAELKTAIKAIRHGKSLVITGPFGMGKTSFAMRLGSLLPKYKFLHCTFENDSRKIVETLNRQLTPSSRTGDLKLASQIHLFTQHATGRKCLIAIDDIWKVTLQKVRFFKSLNASQNCQFIFISELSNKDSLSLVKSIAWNNTTIPIPKLSLIESVELFESKLHLTQEGAHHYKKLIESCGGYPLNVIEATKIFTRSLSQP